MTTIHGIAISSGDGLRLYEVSWEGGSACSMPLVYRYMCVYVKVHVCILDAVSYRRRVPTFSAVDMAQPEKGLFSNLPRIYPPPPTSNSIHSWHVHVCMYVHVGCGQ